MQQKLVQFFLPQESGTFGHNIEKVVQKPRSKLKKYIFTDNIVVYCKTVLIF